MANTKKPNLSAKCKYWANGVTGESSGSMVGCIRFMFLALPHDKQQKLVADLQSILIETVKEQGFKVEVE